MAIVRQAALQQEQVTPTAGALEKASRHLVRKLGGYFGVTEEIADALDELCTEAISFGPHYRIIGSGERYGAIYLVESGWVIRASHLEDGRRQIVNVALPGDFLCFNAALFETSDFDLTTRTHVKAFRIEVPKVVDLLTSQAKLALALNWANAHEEALLAERIVSIGRRSAREKVAHLICEIIARLRIIGMYDDGQLILPLSQEDLADILGLSLIHTNRTIRAFVAGELLVYRAGEVTIIDERKLRKIAGFDGDYLHFTQLSAGQLRKLGSAN